MSLLYNQFELFNRFREERETDSEGGTVIKWHLGTPFRGVVKPTSSVRSKESETRITTDTYTLTVKRIDGLEFSEVIQRLRDGKTFRVISNGLDNETPEFVGLDMRQYTVERCEIPK